MGFTSVPEPRLDQMSTTDPRTARRRHVRSRCSPPIRPRSATTGSTPGWPAASSGVAYVGHDDRNTSAVVILLSRGCRRRRRGPGPVRRFWSTSCASTPCWPVVGTARTRAGWPDGSDPTPTTPAVGTDLPATPWVALAYDADRRLGGRGAADPRRPGPCRSGRAGSSDRAGLPAALDRPSSSGDREAVAAALARTPRSRRVGVDSGLLAADGVAVCAGHPGGDPAVPAGAHPDPATTGAGHRLGQRQFVGQFFSALTSAVLGQPVPVVGQPFAHLGKPSSPSSASPSPSPGSSSSASGPAGSPTPNSRL